MKFKMTFISIFLDRLLYFAFILFVIIAFILLTIIGTIFYSLICITLFVYSVIIFVSQLEKRSNELAKRMDAKVEKDRKRYKEIEKGINDEI